VCVFLEDICNRAVSFRRVGNGYSFATVALNLPPRFVGLCETAGPRSRGWSDMSWIAFQVGHNLVQSRAMGISLRLHSLSLSSTRSFRFSGRFLDRWLAATGFHCPGQTGALRLEIGRASAVRQKSVVVVLHLHTQLLLSHLILYSGVVRKCGRRQRPASYGLQ